MLSKLTRVEVGVRDSAFDSRNHQEGTEGFMREGWAGHMRFDIQGKQIESGGPGFAFRSSVSTHRKPNMPVES